MKIQPVDLDDVPRLLRERIAHHVTRADAALARPSGVHEARKHLKKIRAALRLLRDVAGERLYKRANRAFRDAGRPLSAARDADVMIETLDGLRKRAQRRAATLASMRATLVERRRDARRAVVGAPGERARLRAAIVAAGRQVERWPDAGAGGWRVIRRPLREAYRVARRALRRARRRADDDDAWHECRKRAKDLRYHLEFFAPLAAEAIGPLAAQAKALTDALGNDHDLAVLATSTRDIGDAARSLVGDRRAALKAEAERLGAELFAERPRAFAGRMHTFWKSFAKR